MSPEMKHQEVLPKDLLEMQLGQVDLLLAMYASDDAVSMSDASSTLVDQLKDWCEGDEETPPSIDDSSVSIHLTLALSNDDETASKQSLELDITLPVVVQRDNSQGTDPSEAPRAKIRARQPSWMSKSDVAKLNDNIPDEDLLTLLEHIQNTASQHLTSLQTPSSNKPIDTDQPIVRAWFYFPSISTRSKRDDLINHAPAYSLTGFLLAGKPGVLCLEGGSQAIDDFMRFIKTESWGDFPPQHKKVSERYRESGPDLARAFADMREITDLVGERRGERANRNDMKALESWLNENGVGEAFAKVLI